MSKGVTIIGAGLAGCTVAWQCYLRGVDFTLIEREEKEAGSLAAAGMLAPVTGKAFNPSWKIDDFYAPARAFYARVEEELQETVWYDYPVVRLFFSSKDREKFFKKQEKNPALGQWVAEVLSEVPEANAEWGAVVWNGSGRLDVRRYVLSTRAFFKARGAYLVGDVPLTSGDHYLYTTGAKGLRENAPLPLPHRSAKGEILTVKVTGLAQDRIISRGTWMVPTGRGDETFLVGANYDWDDLSNTPTADGRATVEKGLRSLISLPYTIIDHVAGVRPIVRQSEPVIGTVSAGKYVMNGLGSKGVLYAPETARHLLDHILLKKEIPAELDIAGVIS